MNQFSFKAVTFLILISILVIGCREDNINLNSNLFEDDELVEVTVVGKAIIIDGPHVLNLGYAQINLGDYEARTTYDGHFSFTKVKVKKSGAVISYTPGTHHDLMPAFQKIYPEAGKTYFVEITSLPPTFSSNNIIGNGGLVETPEFSIDFSTSEFVDESGASVSSPISIKAAYIDPTNPMHSGTVPGDFVGLDSEQSFVSLASYGMIAVELQKEGTNEKVNLAPGSHANIKVKVPEKMMENNVPLRIPLWHLNESNGIWEEEGEALLVGNYYHGKVSHFSFWNCDAPFPVTSLTGYVSQEDGTPIPNLTIRLTMTMGASSYGTTDSEGNFKGMIPSNEELLLEIIELNGTGETIIYSSTIGPFSSPATINIILGEEEQSLITSVTKPISFDIDFCHEDSISSSASLQIFKDGDFVKIISIPNSGTHEFHQFLAPPNISSYEVQIFDYSNTPVSPRIAIEPTIEPVHLGSFTVCENIEENFIHVEHEASGLSTLMLARGGLGHDNYYISGDNFPFHLFRFKFPSPIKIGLLSPQDYNYTFMYEEFYPSLSNIIRGGQCSFDPEPCGEESLTITSYDETTGKLTGEFDIITPVLTYEASTGDFFEEGTGETIHLTGRFSVYLEE